MNLYLCSFVFVPCFVVLLLRRWLLCWCLISGTIHVVLEGYFVVFHKSLRFRTDLLAQIWKEYAKSDSRYLDSDVGLVTIEIITAFLFGPWLLKTALKIYRNKNEMSYAPSLLIISTGQLYGTIMYFAESIRFNPYPYSPYCSSNFYVYFVLFNLPWLIVPIMVIRWSLLVFKEKIKNH